MPLEPGTSIGPYTVVARLGEGGMGEVYRARDSKLKREVALKVLPADVANDRERLARFQREAEVLASLNHPNIAHVYGIEENALVMELVEGEDLSERIKRGPIPIDEALPIAKQIAEALEAAHELGIIHRDLKPANIKVRGDGTVKVLDFGLAKALQDPKTSGPQDLVNSPTITSSAMTRAGVILGTAAYMSPEQARGKPVDRRADIWAYGAVVYEMLSGRHAFDGDDVTQTLARVLEREPDWAAIAGTPAPVTSVVRRCLDKDPRRRLRDIGEARILFETAALDGHVAPVPSAPAPARRQPLLPWTIAAAALLAAIGLATWQIRQPAPAAGVVRASIQLPDGMEVPQGDAVPTSIAVSPDGTTIAFTAVTAGQRSNDAVLYVRRLDQGEPTVVADSAGARSPVFSPDSRWLAFFSRGELKKVSLSVSGSAPATLARDLNNFWGAAWPNDGVILYSNPQTSGEMLYGIPESGGAPTLLMRAGPQDLDLSFPRIFDGNQLLASRWTGGLYGNGQIVAVSRQTNSVSKVILDGGSHGQLLPSGHLVFARGNELLAATFVPSQMEIRGTPTRLLDNVLTDQRYGTPQFDVSPAGVLAFAPRPRNVEPWALVSVDRAGKIDVLFEDEYLGGAEPASFASNASHVVYQSLAPNRDLDLFAYEIASGRRIRLTTERGEEFGPALSPDGRAVVYGGWRLAWGIFRVPLIGGREERLPFAAGITNIRAGSFSPDGRWLVVSKDSPYVSDLGIVDLTAKSLTVRWQAETRFIELQPRFSPTGRHVAYESDQLGRTDVWVVPFADGVFGDAVPISKDGGVNPFWSADGRQLYFSSGPRLFVSTLGVAKEGVPVSPPREVLTAADLKFFAAISGDRFLAIRRRYTPVTRIEIVLNWIDELREQVRP